MNKNDIELGVEYLAHYPMFEYGPLAYAHEGDSGFDLRAATEGFVVLQPGESTAVNTGVCFDIPEGFEVQVRPRSGLALKYAITVVNAPGTVDQGFKGEVKVILANLGGYQFVVNPGDRIAQAVLAPVQRARLVSVLDAGNSERGASGFGSTGVA